MSTSLAEHDGHLANGSLQLQQLHSHLAALVLHIPNFKLITPQEIIVA